MVARKRTKWRFHCSSCGVAFDVPKTWAYCSKDCESGRGTDAPAMPGFLVDRRLILTRKLEVAMPWDRRKLLAAIANLDAEAQRMAPDYDDGNAGAGTMTMDDAAFWSRVLGRDATRIEQASRRRLQVAIVMGRRLLDARASLPRGEFGCLFHDHPSPVDYALPFSARWGRILMRIAAHAVTGSRKSTSALPAELMTVYELSLAPEADVAKALERGDVHPAMSIEDAKRIREGM